MQGAVIEGVRLERFDDHTVELEVDVRPRAKERWRCPMCGVRCGRYDPGAPARRWRTLDLGTIKTFVVAQLPRVNCPEHGVLAAGVPWARPHARFTRRFEDQVAWLATNTSKTAVAGLMRIAWRTVGEIIQRVVVQAMRGRDRLAGLRRIGIDEISWRRGHRFLTVVVDHDTGRLVWVGHNRGHRVVHQFLDDLGQDRCDRLELVSCDLAGWITQPIETRCPHACVCLDAFHVVQVATRALDQVRGSVWRQAHREGMGEQSRQLSRSRFALWKNPQNLTTGQAIKLAGIQRTNQVLFRAYLLKEQLRQIWRAPSYREAMEMFDNWLSWARRSQITPFVTAAHSLGGHRHQIAAALYYGLSNARIEATNTRIRLIARRAYGFHSPDALIALTMLAEGGACPPLPGR